MQILRSFEFQSNEIRHMSPIKIINTQKSILSVLYTWRSLNMRKNVLWIDDKQKNSDSDTAQTSQNDCHISHDSGQKGSQ